MPNEERPLSSYDIEFTGSNDNLYVFSTTQGYTYNIFFKPSGYVFAKYPIFADDTFEFVIALTNGPPDSLPLSDPLIEPTIVKIFQDFFARRGVVVVYICDSSDNRQAVRHRMFNRWFDRYKHLGFVKFDAQLLDPSSTIYTSVMVHRSYPHRAAVFEAFLDLTDEINEGK